MNKLIREAKLLRDRHGSEAQREKCTKKADKLIAEVYALKTIKDDDISKFGILNDRGLNEILQSQSSSDSVRIMARVAHYKTLSRRLQQFKERFPDCKKHFAENNKKTTKKLKDKNATKTRKSKENNTQSKSSKKQKVDLDKNVEQPQHEEDEEACNNKLSEARSNSRKRKKTSDEDCTSLEKQKLKLEKDNTSEATNRPSSVIKPSGVTKEATVKRFAELLEEQEVNQDAQISVENQDSTDTATEQVKMADDFFIAKDDQNCQGNNASTSYTRSPRHNIQARAFQSKDRIKKQNTNRKNDINLSKKHSGKQSFSMKSKKPTSTRINKNVNKNASENAIVNKKDENISLHPSWMAKKKEQEIMSRGFQGKKIVFADN